MLHQNYTAMIFLSVWEDEQKQFYKTKVLRIHLIPEKISQILELKLIFIVVVK